MKEDVNNYQPHLTIGTYKTVSGLDAVVDFIDTNAPTYQLYGRYKEYSKVHKQDIWHQATWRIDGYFTYALLPHDLDLDVPRKTPSGKPLKKKGLLQ